MGNHEVSVLPLCYRILYGHNEENIDKVKSVYSMMPMVQIIFFLCEIETGKNGVGNKQEREKERARETD
jgi:hypothetical protein